MRSITAPTGTAADMRVWISEFVNRFAHMDMEFETYCCLLKMIFEIKKKRMQRKGG